MITILRDSETALSFILDINGTNSNPSDVRVILGTHIKILVSAKSADNKNYTAVIPPLNELGGVFTTASEIPFKIEVLINGKVVVPFKTDVVIDTSMKISFEPESLSTVTVEPEVFTTEAEINPKPTINQQEGINIEESIKVKVKGMLRDVMGQSAPLGIDIASPTTSLKEMPIIPAKTKVKLIKGEIVFK